MFGTCYKCHHRYDICICPTRARARAAQAKAAEAVQGKRTGTQLHVMAGGGADNKVESYYVCLDCSKRRDSLSEPCACTKKPKCPIEGCDREVFDGNVHCAYHYFSLPDDELRKNQRAAGWETETGGMKFDRDKPRMDLIDAFALEELAKVLTFGAVKYAPNNWRKGITFGRLLAASFRHLVAILRGQDRDEETGLYHAAHLMCCAMFLVWMHKHKPEMDDRYAEEKQTRTATDDAR